MSGEVEVHIRAPRAVAPLLPGQHVVIIGAGPAGLTAGYLLSKDGVRATILEADDIVGGISRTAQYKGFRFDIGGHRFFTKVAPVQALWEEILGDEFISVPRLSRIYYDGKFFDYPLKAANARRMPPRNDSVEGRSNRKPVSPSVMVSARPPV